MEGTAQWPRPLTCLPSMAGGPAMDEAIVVPWCWGNHRSPRALGGGGTVGGAGGVVSAPAARCGGTAMPCSAI